MINESYLSQLVANDFDYNKFIFYISFGHRMEQWEILYYTDIMKEYYLWKLNN